MSFALPAMLWMNILPGIIAAKIASGNGLPPFVGFAAGFFGSWLGMAAIAVLGAMVGASSPGHSARRRHGQLSSGASSSRSKTAAATRQATERAGRRAGRARQSSDAQRARDAKLLQKREEELRERDELVAEHEQELERLRAELMAAQERLEHVRDPWRDVARGTEDQRLPDSLPADLPRARFDDEDDTPAQRSAGGTEG